MAELVTIPNVEIVSTGTYDLASPGTYTFTTDDLADAVKATEDPACHAPRLKIGHDSDFGDGEPAFGKAVNLRLDDEGHTIMGDFVGVPKWLADIMPTAYPSRSIEGPLQTTTATGKHYNLIIEAVSLLGVRAPGVSTLADLALLYEADEPEGLEIVNAGDRIVAKLKDDQGDPMKFPKKKGAKATVEVEDVRREYYDSLDSNQVWWWIRAIELDPDALIVDDDEGHLYRVPFSISGESITFEDPAEVEIVYTEVGDKAAAAIAAAGSGTKTLASFKDRSESRPDNQESEEGMDPKELRASLGLAEDASDKEVKAKLEELKASAEEKPPADPPKDDDDKPKDDDEESADEGDDDDDDDDDADVEARGVLIDKDAHEQLKSDAAAGREARETQLSDDRETYLDKAVRAGKFPPASREAYAAQLAKGGEIEKSTKAFIDKLAANTVPVNELGESPSDDVEAGSGYDESWLTPQERSRIRAARDGESDLVTNEKVK